MSDGVCSICFETIPWGCRPGAGLRESRRVVLPPAASRVNVLVGTWCDGDLDTCVCHACFRRVLIDTPHLVISPQRGLCYFGPHLPGHPLPQLPDAVATTVLSPIEYATFVNVATYLRSRNTTRLVLCPRDGTSHVVARDKARTERCETCQAQFCCDCGCEIRNVDAKAEVKAEAKMQFRAEVGAEVSGRACRAADQACPRCDEAREAVLTPAVCAIPGNKAFLLRWSGCARDQLTPEPYNRYVRLLPEHRTAALRAPASCLHEAAYCYPASAVPALALARHLVRVVVAPAGEVAHPVTDVPLEKTSACNALENAGVTVCNVCQAVSTPGDPLPQDHWSVCPRFDHQEHEVTTKMGMTCRTLMRKRFAAYMALRSVTLDTRRAAVRLLEFQGPASVISSDERWAWDHNHKACMPSAQDLARMDAHETTAMLDAIVAAHDVVPVSQHARKPTRCIKRRRVGDRSSTDVGVVVRHQDGTEFR